MKIIRKRPRHPVELIDIPGTYKAVANAVGGRIGKISIGRDICIVCDRDGAEKGRDICMNLDGIDVSGTVLVVKCTDAGFDSLTDVDSVLDAYFDTVRYTRIDKKHNVWRCRKCQFTNRFEADGPFENGWNCCPCCGKNILNPEVKYGI